jgi:predicted HicB family RNase H-like nuclease
MTETTDDGVRDARRARHDAIRAEVAQEEAKAAEAEVTERAAALEVPLHLRIDRELDAQLRRQAAEAHVPTSALVRRLLRQAVQEPREQLTAADVESIARRVAREELHRA